MTISNNKLLIGASGGKDDPINVEDVFSVFLYEGNGSTKTIENGIAISDGLGAGTSTAFESADFLDKTFSESARTQMTFSAWLWADSNFGGKTFFRNGATSAAYEVQVQVDSSANLDFKVTTGNQSKAASGQNKAFSFEEWHNILFSVNTATGAGHLYVDDNDVGISLTGITGEDIKPLLTSFGIMKGENSSTRTAGRVAHVYIDYTYRNFTTESNRRIFINENGSSTSPSTLAALNPVIYLPMTEDYAIGKNLGTGGDFTATGSPVFTNSGTDFLSDYGEGGLVWIKNMDQADDHVLTDTVRGATKITRSNSKTDETTDADTLTAFNSAGFSVGADVKVNTNNETYCSWTFRKTPNFFDIVTYTGSGSAQNISHNLGVVPGMVMIKERAGDEHWRVWHRDFEDGDHYLSLSDQNPVILDNNNQIFNATDPTSSVFTVGTDNSTNGSNKTYVAYLFAHNNNDGTFGPDGDLDIIKCGVYTGTGNESISNLVSVGFEPQFVIVKRLTGGSEHWFMGDTQRGWRQSKFSNDNGLIQVFYPNDSTAQLADALLWLTNDGFALVNNNSKVNSNNSKYIYMAIRAGRTGIPETATDVFNVSTDSALSANEFMAGTERADMVISTSTSTGTSRVLSSRFTGGDLFLQAQNDEEGFRNSGGYVNKWTDPELKNNEFSGGPATVHWSWKRAASYFDVSAFYSGDSANRRISHKLGVVPEMVWVFCRTANRDRFVYHKDMDANPRNYSILINEDDAKSNTTAIWGTADPTTTDFGLNESNVIGDSNLLGIAYLFATAEGVSKVGSVSHSGSSTDVDCGFAAGSRFVLLKRTDAAGNWYIWDSVRGIVAGNDPYLLWNGSAAQTTNTDFIDPLASGFQISGNFTDGDYIFYAIA